MSEFTHQVILITGASSGIGKALAGASASHSPKLVLVARDQARLQEVALTCESLGESVLVISTDVTDPQACSAMIQHAVSKFSRIDVLINKAGMSMWSAVEDVQDAGLFQRLMAVNFFGSISYTHLFLGHGIGHSFNLVALCCQQGDQSVFTRQVRRTYNDQHVAVFL